jgi:hypothetical protein
MKDASGFQTQELLSSMPPRFRHPLRRTPGRRVPAASSQASCRGRNTVGLRRPGPLKITASCVHRPSGLTRLLLAGPCAPTTPARISRASPSASFTPTQNFAAVSFKWRARKAKTTDCSAARSGQVRSLRCHSRKMADCKVPPHTRGHAVQFLETLGPLIWAPLGPVYRAAHTEQETRQPPLRSHSLTSSPP